MKPDRTLSQRADTTQVMTKTYRGACHCGAVTFEAEFDLSKGVGKCNCSLCIKVNQASAMVKPAAFKLLTGADRITEYRVGKSPNSRSFCSTCGIQCFGAGDVPEIGGAFVSVNTNCLEGVELAGLPTHHLDGRHDNWMAGPRPEMWPLAPFVYQRSGV